MISFDDFSINVTRAHINSAMPGSSTSCPIAEAIQESLGDNCYRPWVTKDFISFSLVDKGVRLTYRTPRNASVFVRSMDQNRRPRPFTLTLDESNLVRIEQRKTHQREKQEHVARVRHASQVVAHERKIPVREARELVKAGKVPVPVWDSTGDPILPPAPRSKVRSDQKPASVQRSKRETTSEAFRRLGVA